MLKLLLLIWGFFDLIYKYLKNLIQNGEIITYVITLSLNIENQSLLRFFNSSIVSTNAKQNVRVVSMSGNIQEMCKNLLRKVQILINYGKLTAKTDSGLFWESPRMLNPQFDHQFHQLLLCVGCFTSKQHASVSQGRICSDKFSCCHTEIEVVDQLFYLTPIQYTDTGPTSPSADPLTPGAWQSSHLSVSTQKNPHGANGNRTPDLPLSRRTIIHQNCELFFAINHHPPCLHPFPPPSPPPLSLCLFFFI